MECILHCHANVNNSLLYIIDDVEVAGFSTGTLGCQREKHRLINFVIMVIKFKILQYFIHLTNRDTIQLFYNFIIIIVILGIQHSVDFQSVFTQTNRNWAFTILDGSPFNATNNGITSNCPSCPPLIYQ